MTVNTASFEWTHAYAHETSFHTAPMDNEFLAGALRIPSLFVTVYTQNFAHHCWNFFERLRTERLCQCKPAVFHFIHAFRHSISTTYPRTRSRCMIRIMFNRCGGGGLRLRSTVCVGCSSLQAMHKVCALMSPLCLSATTRLVLGPFLLDTAPCPSPRTLCHLFFEPCCGIPAT